MKYLFILFSLTFFASADYLHTTEKNICVYDITPYQNNTGWCYVKRSDNVNYCDKLLDMHDLLDGYEYLNSACELKNDLKLTGLSQSEFNYLFALIAHAIGFTMLFLINYLAISIARK